MTSGPGATNTVTGIADAMIDSTPIVVIAGQVGTGFLGTDAFQEVDLVIIMAYTPTVWKNGDVITAELLNHLETGVQNEQVGPESGAPSCWMCCWWALPRPSPPRQ